MVCNNPIISKLGLAAQRSLHGHAASCLVPELGPTSAPAWVESARAQLGRASDRPRSGCHEKRCRSRNRLLQRVNRQIDATTLKEDASIVSIDLSTLTSDIGAVTLDVAVMKKDLANLTTAGYQLRREPRRPSPPRARPSGRIPRRPTAKSAKPRLRRRPHSGQQWREPRMNTPATSPGGGHDQPDRRYLAQMGNHRSQQQRTSGHQR